MRFLPYILKNVRRHKLRSLFTILSIATSLFLVTLLYAYIEFQDELGAESTVYNRVVVTHVQGLTALLPIAHVDRVRAIRGVKDAMPLSWFGGLYQDDRFPFAQFGTDPDHVLNVFAEFRVPADQVQAWRDDRTGCLVGKKIAADRGWAIGDRVALKGTIYPIDLELTVRAIYDGPDSTDKEMLWFHYTYMDELLKKFAGPAASAGAGGAASGSWASEIAGTTGAVYVKAASASAVPDVMRRIEQRFASSDAPVRAMTEQAFGQMFAEMIGNVQVFIRNTALAVVFSLVCVAGNAMAMSLRERTREVAVLKAIGFQRWTILGMVLGEALAIALLGGILGVAGVKLMFIVVDASVLGIPGLSLFYVPWRTVWFGLALAAFVGLASGAIPAWRAAQMSVLDGLRKVV